MRFRTDSDRTVTHDAAVFGKTASEVAEDSFKEGEAKSWTEGALNRFLYQFSTTIRLFFETVLLRVIV